MDEYSAKLDKLEEKVSKISVPLAYAEDLYQFRLHIDMLRNRLHQIYEEKITAGKNREITKKAAFFRKSTSDTTIKQTYHFQKFRVISSF